MGGGSSEPPLDPPRSISMKHCNYYAENFMKKSYSVKRYDKNKHKSFCIKSL